LEELMGEHAGIDVSAKTLHVAACGEGDKKRARCFLNTASGREALVTWLVKLGVRRVVLEASGIYSLDIALTLDRDTRLEVMVVNPRAARAFANALMKRAKTDPVDAEALLEFCVRMAFVVWPAPSEQVLALRAVTRRVAGLVRNLTAEKNRRHAAQQTTSVPQFVLDDIDDSIKLMTLRIKRLTRAGIELVRADAALSRRFDLLLSVIGIAETSALKLIAELSLLPHDMTVRQWVAHAGLDPRPWTSGTSVHGMTRISKKGNKRLRIALFMPALVAVQREPHVQLYFQHLVDNGKCPKSATVAVMRKLLHAIYGMFKHDQEFNGKLFYRPQVRGPTEPEKVPEMAIPA
jgi:transposase